MTNLRNTKRALLSSVVALCICFSMLLGTTFAWFTDSVTSSGNIIQAGDLEVTMEFANGTTDPANTQWTDADGVAIFNYDLWEPGYVEVKHIKISNEGNLALKYYVTIQANGAATDLAEVIDVYYVDPAVQVTRREQLNQLPAENKLGTLKQVLAGMADTASGVLLAGENDTITIALKMQESAGDEYQEKSIGTSFSIKLVATQYDYEEDSFGKDYDADVLDPRDPQANVVLADPNEQIIFTHDDGSEAVIVDNDLAINYYLATDGLNLGNAVAETGNLSVGFQFKPTTSAEDVENSEYKYWHADFVVSADKDIPAEALALAGYYEAWCHGLTDHNWIALASTSVIAEGTQIRLVETLGTTVNWEEICQFGNDGLGFVCGLLDLSNGQLAGTTITVELRIYETTGDPNTPDGPKNIETGVYYTVGTYTYTFE